MPDTIRDLWPDDIAIDALSPAMILNEQAEALSKKTKGLVQGELLQDFVGNWVNLQFDVVSGPAAFRQRILAVRYRKDQPYPVVVTAPQLQHQSGSRLPDSSWGIGEDVKSSRVANTPADFETFLEVILGSSTVVSLILALRARANETKSPPRVTHRQLSSAPELPRGDESVRPESHPENSSP